MENTPLDILTHYWGYTSFRPMQAEIVQSVLDGHDTLALLPTGGGKSICFQVPALLQKGVCLVISPLVALMKDQVRQLQDRGIKAEALYAGLSRQDIDRIVDNAVYGHLKFLYLSPERLKTDVLTARLPKMPVNLIAVDEAHCISQWGYDFRPPYLEIATIREFLPKVPVMALTATATPAVVDDIQDKLAFGKTKQVFQKSFVRDNLSYVVRQAEGKLAQLVRVLERVPGSSVVYVRNRRRCKDIAIDLVRRKIAASFYHAGLDMEERSKRQQAWIDGRIRVMVATNAFGMGIDKSDVRTVVHMDLPDSLEAYFQEAGRAGRDGEKAYAILLYNKAEKERLWRNHEQAFPTLAQLRRVYTALGSYLQLATGGGFGHSYDFDLPAFAQTYQLDAFEVHHCLKVLEHGSWLSVSEAVYTPANLQVIVNKDVLYDYQLKHSQYDRILKIILRSYQGAFSHPVKLKESQLAKFLKMGVGKLRQSLQAMHKAEIVRYQPAKDTPQLTFLHERVPAETLNIDQLAYRERKERQHQRITAAIQYAETAHCRSAQLVRYFGEQKTEPCGICDVCLDRKARGLSATDHERIAEKLETLLKEEPLTTKAIVARFANVPEEDVIQSLHYLVDEGFVALDEQQRCVWVK